MVNQLDQGTDNNQEYLQKQFDSWVESQNPIAVSYYQKLCKSKKRIRIQKYVDIICIALYNRSPEIYEEIIASDIDPNQHWVKKFREVFISYELKLLFFQHHFCAEVWHSNKFNLYTLGASSKILFFLEFGFLKPIDYYDISNLTYFRIGLFLYTMRKMLLSDLPTPK